MNTENELKKDELIIKNFEKFIKNNKYEQEKDLKLFLIDFDFKEDLVVAANLIIKELERLNIDWLDYVCQKMKRNVIVKNRYGWEKVDRIIFVNMFKSHLLKYLASNESIDLIDLLILIMFILYLDNKF